MSIALVEAIETLLITAATHLTAEIKAETNPDRKIKLLAIAFRTKLPRDPAVNPTTRSGRAAEAAATIRAAAGCAPSNAEHSTSTAEAAAPRTADLSAAPANSSPLPALDAQVSPLPPRDIPLEELFKDDIAAFAAEIAKRRHEPGPYVYATDYLIKNNYIVQPRNADGTPIPLVDEGPRDGTVTHREKAVLALKGANCQFNFAHQNRCCKAAAAAKACREARSARKPKPARATDNSS